MGFAFITRYRRRQLAAQALGIELGKQPMHDLMPKLEADEKALARYTEAAVSYTHLTLPTIYSV